MNWQQQNNRELQAPLLSTTGRTLFEEERDVCIRAAHMGPRVVSPVAARACLGVLSLQHEERTMNDLWNFNLPHFICEANLAWFALGILAGMLVIQYAQKVMR